MAEIFYQQSGAEPNPDSRLKIDLKTFELKFEGIAKNFIEKSSYPETPFPRLPSQNPQIDGMRKNDIVLLEVIDKDLQNYKSQGLGFHVFQYQKGFYKLNLSISECERIIKEINE